MSFLAVWVEKTDGPGLPDGLIIFLGPPISSKRTPLCPGGGEHAAARLHGHGVHRARAQTPRGPARLRGGGREVPAAAAPHRPTAPWHRSERAQWVQGMRVTVQGEGEYVTLMAYMALCGLNGLFSWVCSFASLASGWGLAWGFQEAKPSFALFGFSA